MTMMEHQNPADSMKAEDIQEAANEIALEATLAEVESGSPVAIATREGEDAAPDLAEVKLALEAALLASSEPLQSNDLKKLFEGRISGETLRILLDEIRTDWTEKSIELTMVANGWRFRVKPDYQKYIDRLNPEKPPKYSRAVMETLAIIAYRQPVTRGDIEDIRGVVVSAPILQTLEARGWIDVVGHRETPGRPSLYATTRGFLDDLGLRSLQELPPLDEIARTLPLEPPEPQSEAGAPATFQPAESGASAG